MKTIIDKKKLLIGLECYINERFYISQYKLQDLLVNFEILQKRTFIQNLFITIPKDLWFELYDNSKVYYWDIQNYQFFLSQVYSFKIEEFNECMSFLLLEKDNKKIKFNFQFEKKEQNVILIDKENDIVLDEILYNQIREALKLLSFNEDHDIDDTGIHSIAQFKALFDIEKQERALLKLRGMEIYPTDNVDQIEKMISLVANFSSGINYFNIGQYTLYQLISSYIKIINVLEYKNMQSGLYGNLDYSKVDMERINNLI